MRLRPLLVLVVLLAAVPSAALAAGCPRVTVADLEDEVMCPVCGTSLGLAREAPQAQRERAFIERLAASCRSKEEIKAQLVAQFGASVLALPDDRGFGASAYVVPVAGALAGAGLAILVLLGWRRRARTRSAAGGRPGHLESSDALRLEAELDRIR